MRSKRAPTIRTYRIITTDGVELAAVQAASLLEVIATAEASLAPIGARIVAEGQRVLARLELWTGGHPGWSLDTTAP